MRLLELRLAAFGPFSDVTLDLSTAQPGLHVIYGGNEAGKSTALRALTGFFFGFPHVTPDTHVHKQLRVGARLIGDDGTELDLVRKKGRKRTLTDAGDHVVDEAPLRRLLGGVGPELFTTIFGLDHETLRSGADTLVRGKGHVGESLFEVGLGTAGLSEVLDDLRKQADAIYSPRARTRPLNEALKNCVASKQEIRRQSVTAQAYLVQESGLENARAEAAQCEEKLRALTRQRHRLERVTRTLPLLARREQLRSRREELGDVRLLPEDTPQRRESARRTMSEATARLEELEAKLRDLCAERDTLPVPQGPADEEQQRERLAARLAAHEQSAARMPTLRGELSRLETDARGILRGLGRDDALEAAEGLRIDTPTHARITKLALDAGPIASKLAATKHARDDLEARTERLSANRDAMPPEPDVAELARARAQAVRAGDLEAQLRQADEASGRGREVVEDLAEAVGVPRGEASAAAHFAVPTLAEVTGLAEQHRELTSEQSRATGLLAESRERAAEVHAALDALAGEGDIPSETDLERARTARDAEFVALLGSRKPLSPQHPDVHRFEKSVTAADAIADRLRREADRVARKARLAADQGQLAATIEDRKAELARLSRKLDEHRDALAELFGELPVRARSAGDWLVWLGRHGELVRAERASTALTSSRAAITKQAEELCDSLRKALTAHAEKEPLVSGDPAKHLAVLLDATGSLEQRLQAVSRSREDVEQALRTAQQDLTRARSEHREADAAYATWREAWEAAVTPLGLTVEASPEEATAVQSDLANLFRKIDEASRVTRELATEEKTAQDFGDEVCRIARERAPGLSDAGDPTSIARAVVAHLSEQIRARSERERIDDEQRAMSALTGEQRERSRVAELELGELVRLASAEDVAGLLAAEAKSLEAQTLDEQIATVDEQLLSHGDGASVQTLAEEARSSSPDEVATQLESVHASIEELDRDRLATQRRIGELEVGLGALGGPNRAVDAALTTEQHLAEAARLVAEYARLRTAVAFLEREIEAYREANQDPLLRRAGQLLSRLTRGRYQNVHATPGEDDGAVFSVDRNDGSELDVEALSDGTRDQLYLALRMATLERRVKSAEPMPFVLDDILVHFDDERATAALELLGELAERVQILFFTHHARLRELARAAVPAERLREHELPAPATTEVAPAE